MFNEEITNEDLVNGRRELLELDDPTFARDLSIDKRFDMTQRAKISVYNGEQSQSPDITKAVL